MKSPKEEIKKGMGSAEEVLLPKSPLDLWRMMGGQAERVKTKEGRLADSMLAVYKDRLTYTFIMGHEVASIHFNRAKREIFFRGHNIVHYELNAEKTKALEELKKVLASEERGNGFLSDYETTLDRCLADKRK